VIEEYFHTTLTSIELKVVKPSLKDYTKGIPLVKYYVDGEYSAKAVKHLAKGREFLYKESLIELEDDLFGIIDEPTNLYLLEWKKGNEFVKKAGVDAAN